MAGQADIADDSEAVEAEVEGFIARFAPEIAARVRGCRDALRARLPGAIELVYDNYNALAIGYGPAERASEAVVSIAAYPRVVRLFFLQGATLPDPDHILSGTGNQVRSLVLAGAGTLDVPAVAAMLAEALARAARPLAPAGGRTIVKSISAKQRPRRPQPKDSA